MSDAPERIFMSKGPDEKWSLGDSGSAATLYEYIRTDLSDALMYGESRQSLDSLTALNLVVGAIQMLTVGTTPRLSDLPGALMQWRDEAVLLEREACAKLAEATIVREQGSSTSLGNLKAEEIALAIRARSKVNDSAK